MAIDLKLPSWVRVPAWMRGGAAVSRPRWSWLEPRYPLIAFDVEPRSLAMVRAGRRKADTYLASYGVEAVPPELIELDFYKAKLTSPDSFRQLVAGVVAREPVKFDRASILLPDSYARVAILPFDELPRSRREALELVRWKTKKSVPFRVEDASIDYTVIPSEGPGVQVLAVLTPRSIVEEFEQAFEAAGVHVGLVDLSTLSLINLYRDVMSRENARGEEFLLANICASFFTFVVYRGREMILFRTKPAGTGDSGDGGEGALRLLRRELQTSLLYYREKLEGKGLARAYLRVADLEPRAVESIFASEQEVAAVAWVDPRRVVSLDGRFAGEQGERTLQRLAPALGAAVGRSQP